MSVEKGMERYAGEANMKKGDVVIPANNQVVLACGSGIYTHAICVSVEPYVMISEEGDMRWDKEDPWDYIALCRADAKIVKVAMKRFKEGY